MVALKRNNAVVVYSIPQHEQKRRKLEKKKESLENNDEMEVEVENPASDVWLLKNRKSLWAGKKEGLQRELTEEQNKYAQEYAKKKGLEGARRSWIAPPNDARRNNDHCYVPNRLVHTWSGHTKGVSAIRFFPRHGHLLLSAGMDSKVKIWDVFNSDKCMRTYMGHGIAVRDISFCNDGSKFLSVGYDKNIKRFVTSSDDKSLRVWEFGIPVVIKYISEPHMHSMPAVSLYPNGNWLAAQSLDNQVLIYSTRERFQLKKSFFGHVVAGYACQVNFSPDGRFVMSRDGEGGCWFWDWKSCKVKQTLKCHESVCIGVEWHPLEQKANGLWEMIEPNEKTQADNKKDKTAIAILYQTLPEEQLLQITKHKIAKAIWDARKTRHIGEERVQQARLQTLKSDFKMLHMKEDETIDTFTTKLTTLVNKAASLGHTMEDETLVRKLLNAVPDRYLQIVASVEQYSDLSEMTMEEAIGRLKTYEERINLEAENKTRTIINLKEKKERLLKKIQETNLKSHVTDVTNLDTMLMNVQTNARIKSKNRSAEIAESAETAESVETTVMRGWDAGDGAPSSVGERFSLVVVNVVTNTFEMLGVPNDFSLDYGEYVIKIIAEAGG
nr:hypothetical protein [Tanacetum cinerariifolium]